MGLSVLQIIAIVFFILAFVFATLSIVVFFNNDIADVIGYFTGSTARKQIEQIRNQTTNISYGSKGSTNYSGAYDSLIEKSPIRHTNAGMQIDKKTIPSSKKIKNNPVSLKSNIAYAQSDTGTVSLDTMKDTQNILNEVQDEAYTDVLTSDYTATDILNTDNIPTDILTTNDALNKDLDSFQPTSVLSLDELQSTVVLSQEVKEVDLDGNDFEILEDTTFVDTNEVIS